MTGTRVGTHCFIDRYFTSPTLGLRLLADHKHMTGTCQTNRKGWPKGMAVDKKAKRGEVRVGHCVNTGMRCVSWMDKKVVSMCSTTGSIVDTVETKRSFKNAEGKHERKLLALPSIIHEYNQYMGGVDRLDQLRGTYNLEDTLKTKYWYKKLFMGLFGMGLTNAYILWSRWNKPARDGHKIFMRDLAGELLHIEGGRHSTALSLHHYLDPTDWALTNK